MRPSQMQQPRPEHSTTRSLPAAPLERQAADVLWRLFPSGRRTAAQAWSGGLRPIHGELPSIYVTDEDHARIARLIAGHRFRDHAVASLLARELDRAILCRPDDVPEDAVTMGSRVVFRIGAAREALSRSLVYPEQYRSADRDVPLLTPLGVALLGLREGHGMDYADEAGLARTVAVDMVAFQPEAHRRRMARLPV